MKKNYILLMALAIGVGMTAFSASGITKKQQYIRQKGVEQRRAKMPENPAKMTLDITPVALPATDITETGFTANWESLGGAEGYCMFVYEPIKIEQPGEYAIVSESFNLVDVGSTVEPVWSEEYYVDLGNDLDYTFTPNWGAVGAAFAKGMVSANIYTPSLSLDNNGGKYKLVLDIVANQGTIISVSSCNGDGSEITKKQTATQHGDQTMVFEFDNGTHETWCYIVDEGIEGDDEGNYSSVLSWFDNISVTQELKAGDTALRLVEINDNIAAPASSYRFENLKYLDGATELAYDFYAAYFTYNDPDDPWDFDVDYSKFSNLQSVSLKKTGIEEIVISDASNEEVIYYNMQGVRVQNPEQGGIYVRVQNGKASKVKI